MCKLKFESLQKDESTAHSADSSRAYRYRKPSALNWRNRSRKNDILRWAMAPHIKNNISG